MVDKLVINTLKDVMSLVDDGILVRNTDDDGDFMVYFKQGVRLVNVLKSARDVLDEVEK